VGSVGPEGPVGPPGSDGALGATGPTGPRAFNGSDPHMNEFSIDSTIQNTDTFTVMGITESMCSLSSPAYYS
jgi:hypothetical protein